MESLPPPVQLGEITEQDLKVYDGSDPKKPLLLAIKGQIYDITVSRMFYGPGGPYALFAGKDASRAIALMSYEKKDLTGDLSGLGAFELDALQDWENKFKSRYVKVGTIKKTVPVVDEPSSVETSEVLRKKGPSSVKVGTIKKTVPVVDGPSSVETSEVLRKKGFNWRSLRSWCT